MQFTKLQFAPGINRETTAYTAEGGWYDCDKIRFRAGLPETIGGWQKATNTAMLGVPRSVLPWGTLSGTTYVGVGTNLKYYIVDGQEPFDITPIRRTTTAGAVTFAATNGSSVLTVTDTVNGAYVNDFVTFSGAVSLGGNVTAAVLNREYQIVRIVDADTYEITLSVTANASDVGDGGAAVVGAYQISVGLATSVMGSGWGAGAWGGIGPGTPPYGTSSPPTTTGWGDPASTSIPGAQLRTWSQDNFGEDLLINPAGDGIYLWDASAGLTARAVNLVDLPGADSTPTIAQRVIVSERDRHTIAFGCDGQFNPGVQDPLLIRFSSQENLTDWNVASATNSAGELMVGSGSKIITAIQTKQQILVFTDMSVHAMQFLGPPYTFGIQEISSSTSIASANAAAAVEDYVFWMGTGNFYTYAGTVQPLDCAVKEFVFSDINNAQIAKVCAGHNGAFNEVWWFYPSASSEVNDRYVVYNYVQKVWYYGTMDRTAWADSGLVQYPLASASDGYLYYQESGLDDGSENPAAPLNAYIESAVFDIGEGDQYMFATRMIPDLTFRSSTNVLPEAMFTLKARNFPGAAFSQQYDNTVTKTSSIPVQQFTNQVFIRLRGRSMSLRLESNKTGTAWRLGSPRLDLRTDGRR